MSKKNYIFGYHAIIAALKTMPRDLRKIYLQNERRDRRSEELKQLAGAVNCPIELVTRAALTEMVPQGSLQGVVAEIKITGEYSEDYLTVLLKRYQNRAFFLVLDGVEDPHNLGAALRTANALGVQAVIIPKDRACGITPVVYKVASGAVGVTPVVVVTNLVRTLNQLKEAGLWVYGASEEAEKTLGELSLTPPLAVVMGAEGAGLRALTKKNCDLLFRIPMRGTVPNLNVSVATGIVLSRVKMDD